MARLHFLFHVIHIVALLASNFPPRFRISISEVSPTESVAGAKCKESRIYATDMLAVGVRSAVCRKPEPATVLWYSMDGGRGANFPMHGSLKIHTVISRTDLHNTAANLAITRARIS